MLPAGTKFPTFQPGATATEPGKIVWNTSADGMPARDLQTYTAKAGTDQNADAERIAKLQHENAGTAEQNATASKVPSEIAANKALAFQRGAEGNKANADAARNGSTVDTAPLDRL